MIRISRDNNELYANNNLEIIIDKQKIATLNNGETKVFNINSGKHTITIKSNSLTSNSITFHIRDDETIEFDCGINVKNNSFSKIYYLLFNRSKALWLSVKTNFIE